MNNTNITGINLTKSEILVQDIENYGEELKKTFDEMNILIENLTTSISGNFGELLKNKYNFIKIKYPLLNASVISCAEDVRKICKDYVSFDEQLNEEIRSTNITIE